MAKLKVVPVPVVIEEDDDEPDCPRCPPVGAPAWMATFADMATLLMAFFVLIMSFANFDEVSFKKMTGALREHFGIRIIDLMPNPEGTTPHEMTSPPSSNPPSPQDATDPKKGPEADATSQKPDKAMERLTQALQDAMADGEVTVASDTGAVTVRLPQGAGAAELAKALADAAQDLARLSDAAATGQPEAGGDAAASNTSAGGEAGMSSERQAAIAEARMKVALRELAGQGLVDVQQRRDKVVVTVGAGGAFSSGSAALTDDAREIMARVALAAMGDDVRITVTGHTDSEPLSGGPFVDNWGLAAARASAVVRELSETSGMPASRLSAVSKGDSAPVADNATEAGRSANRRIEIELDFASDRGQP